jgi:hypothetical protein
MTKIPMIDHLIIIKIDNNINLKMELEQDRVLVKEGSMRDINKNSTNGRSQHRTNNKNTHSNSRERLASPSSVSSCVKYHKIELI